MIELVCYGVALAVASSMRKLARQSSPAEQCCGSRTTERSTASAREAKPVRLARASRRAGSLFCAADLPRWVEPQLSKLVETTPAGPNRNPRPPGWSGSCDGEFAMSSPRDSVSAARLGRLTRAQSSDHSETLRRTGAVSYRVHASGQSRLPGGPRKALVAWRGKTAEWPFEAKLGVSFGLLRLHVEANGEISCAGCRLNASSRLLLLGGCWAYLMSTTRAKPVRLGVSMLAHGLAASPEERGGGGWGQADRGR